MVSGLDARAVEYQSFVDRNTVISREMDVKDLLLNGPSLEMSRLSIIGWIVDIDEGLFIFGDHFPENYDFPVRIKIVNGDTIYCIFDVIPKLAGGLSSLFYKCEAFGDFIDEDTGFFVEQISIESLRGGGKFETVDVSIAAVERFVSLAGNYNFRPRRDPARDWLEDI